MTDTIALDSPVSADQPQTGTAHFWFDPACPWA